jgi:hypothetical protein
MGMGKSETWFPNQTIEQWSKRRALPGHIRGKGSHAFQQVGAVASFHILHHHAEVLPRLEAAVHGDDEGIVGKGHDVPLREHLLHLPHH